MPKRFVNKFEAKSMESPAHLTGELPPTPKRPLKNDDSYPNGHAKTKTESANEMSVFGMTFSYALESWTSTGGTETCKSCNGKGFLVI